jgi:hypothetical protein
MQTNCGETSRQAYGFAYARLFGSFRLRAPSGDDFVISNRRARALLAILCLNKGEAMDRDHLSKLLWPGRFEAHSKASLRQCVLDLGKLLAPFGHDMLDVTRTCIALSPGSIQTDLDELEHALARSDCAAATVQLVDIGTKPLLDQMDFGDAFNQWLAKQRNSVAKRLSAAVAAHAQLRDVWSARDLGAVLPAAPSGKIRIAVLPFQSVEVHEGQGYFAAAIADGQRAIDLGFPSVWLGVARAAAGEHDLAVEQYQQTRILLNNIIPAPAGLAPMSPEIMDAYWLVAANGVCSGREVDRETYCRTLDFLHMTMHDKEHLVITLPAVFMGYSEMLFKTLGERISLSNLACMMSIWADIDPICRIWQHPEFISFAQRIGMKAAWEKYGWPDLLPPPSNRV